MEKVRHASWVKCTYKSSMTSEMERGEASLMVKYTHKSLMASERRIRQERGREEEEIK